MAPYDRNSGSNKTGQAALPHKNIQNVAGRKSEMKRVGADSYLCLINKHKEDIIEICGKRIMAKKYLNAANNYMLLNDIEKAKEIYHLSELCGIGLVDKIKFLIRWRNI